MTPPCYTSIAESLAYLQKPSLKAQKVKSYILKLHLGTIWTHQEYVCRWPGLLLQAAFFDPIKL